MTYKNIKTGFVFDSPCEINAEGWVKLDPPVIEKKKDDKAEKPAAKKRTSKE